ncbi:threonine/homoserine/homoserine lactone efflux protein [Pseudacidovorax intermedius]|uniref:Threonine/homoserine/homoserine lactone efflux protein n=2 Tax=Pseudacidovorax intermedius TaxID=433924 RepID=A0A370FKX5_9BURK|nr:LysE family translocator [Pseudacidovorax intermedius]RDI27418.1 threonine/homoserine/homoserine lactone efflux protein [Pseudacidovorax intermedius]
MADIQNYGSFLIAILIFQAVPGAGTVAILDATARGGVRAGMACVGGTLAGDALFMAAAALGLAALLQASPALFGALQWLGAGYLLWMGWGMLRSTASAATAAPDAPRSPRAYAWRAFAISLANPKVMLFFVAFFPLFIAPGASAVTLPLMMLHVTLLSLLWQGLLVVMGREVARRFARRPAARTVATRLGGMALVGLGLKLVAGLR